MLRIFQSGIVVLVNVLSLSHPRRLKLHFTNLFQGGHKFCQPDPRDRARGLRGTSHALNRQLRGKALVRGQRRWRGTVGRGPLPQGEDAQGGLRGLHCGAHHGMMMVTLFAKWVGDSGSVMRYDWTIYIYIHTVFAASSLILQLALVRPCARFWYLRTYLILTVHLPK